MEVIIYHHFAIHGLQNVFKILNPHNIHLEINHKNTIVNKLELPLPPNCKTTISRI